MTSFEKMATITASTKRSPAMVDGKRGAPTTNIASLQCLPLDPVSSEIALRLNLNTPHEVLQTFVQGGLDIQEGDILVVGTDEYPIRAVGDWDWDEDDFKHLIVEDLKT